eukprot:8929647-Alexandrium_andersonii.AAC.1
MSASLVGSEMCIRDSIETAQQSCRAPGDLNLRLLAQRGQGRRLGLEPVSYTHLTLPTICSV